MKYIIFGAGATGKKALGMLGYWRVECFAANTSGDKIKDKEIISYPDMKRKVREKNGKYIIVIASEKYYTEMEKQLRCDNIFNYFIFHETDEGQLAYVYPRFSLFRKDETFSYTRILLLNHVERYKRIAIYGVNLFLHYLISEIAFQAGIEHIVGIVDCMDDERGNTMGLPRCKYEEIEKNIDCLIINKKREEDLFVENLQDYDHPYKCIDVYDIDPLIPEYRHPHLERYKNIHRGKRCFLIGNGPSLKIDDLNVLYRHQEICFAFNRIFKIFDKTLWRPDYLGISDGSVIPANIDEIERGNVITFVADEWNRWIDVRLHNIEPFHLNVQYYKENGHPKFSQDITKGTYFGYSVTYDLGFQFAVYMGFNEIYLLGVDHSFAPRLTDDSNYFMKNYMTDDEKEYYRKITNGKEHTEKEKITRAYEAAERYTKRHGISVFNATRGGELEVFERKDFDSLFEE